jgi:hypothetical protein
MRFSSNDVEIDEFRDTIRKNKFNHKQYNPNLETPFGKYLFKGVLDEKNN